MGPLPSEEEHSKEADKSLTSVSSSGLSSFRSIIWFLSPHLSYPGTLSWVLTHPSAKMALKVKASERSKAHYGLELYLDF